MIRVFAGPSYYPAGGAHDLMAVVPDIGAAEAALELARIHDDGLEWANLYDVGRGVVVRHYTRDGYARDPLPWQEARCWWSPACDLTESED